MTSVTSSFRMPKDFHRTLSRAAQRTGTGKNAIIIEALAHYRRAMERQSLVAEARRQSELVSKKKPDAGWYGLADTSGWNETRRRRDLGRAPRYGKPRPTVVQSDLFNPTSLRGRTRV